MIVAASRRKPTAKSKANAESVLVALNKYGERKPPLRVVFDRGKRRRRCSPSVPRTF